MERNRLSTRIQETQVTKEQETTKALEEHRLNATLRVKLDRVINKLRRVKSEHKRQNDELNRQKELTRHVSKLERNIASLKAAKVSLVKRRRQEEKQYKVWRKNRIVRSLRFENNIVRSFFFLILFACIGMKLISELTHQYSTTQHHHSYTGTEQRAVVKLSRESKRDRIVMDRQQKELMAVTQG